MAYPTLRDNDVSLLKKIVENTAAIVAGGGGGGGGGTWGSITGTLSNQTDLQSALDAKATNPMTAAGDLIVGGVSGAPTALAIGANGYVLTSNGTTAAWSAASSGGTKTYSKFKPYDVATPVSDPATLDTRNAIPVLDFDGGSTNENAVFIDILPESAVVSSGLKVRIHWMASTATSGTCRWGAQFADLSDQDIDGLTFDTATEGQSATSGTSGNITVTELTCTNIDSISAGKPYALKIYRDASDTANDDMAGDAELVAVEVRSAA